MAGNAIITINMVTRKSLSIFRNSNEFLKTIGHQYDDYYARSGAKIGSQLRIRVPNDYVVRTGQTAAPQSTTENIVTLTMATQKGVDVSFSSVDRALSMDDYSERVIEPGMNALGGDVAVDVMSGVEAIPNIVHNIDGSNNTISPTAGTWLTSGAVLSRGSTPRTPRHVIFDPITEARTVATLTGLFNPQAKISQQYNDAMIPNNTLGYATWNMDQSVRMHTTGSFVSGTVSATANQTGTAITVTAITGTLAIGDIITFAGVNGVNRVQKQTNTGTLAQFAITQAAANGATTLNIYPSINPPIAGQAVAYQTVSASPAGGAAIGTASAANETYRKNFAFHPEAVTMCSADLAIPSGGIIGGHRETFDGLSIRCIDYYVGDTDQWATRTDFLYGWLWTRPEYAVVIGDAV